MSKLLDYLNTLDKDAAAREAHASDPKAAMEKFGLSEDEQKALASGDKFVVADHIGVSADDLPVIHSTETTFD